MSRRHLVMLLALASIWGASFMFIKVAVGELDPATTALGRVALGALALAAVVLLRMPAREAARGLRAAALPIALVGALNSALPFWLLNWAETRIESGLAAMLQASAPLFTALLALAFVRAERVSGVRLLGFGLGFGGVALLVGGVPGGSVLASLAVLGTALCYAGAALYAARRLVGVPTLVTAFGSLAAATVISLPAGIARLPDRAPGWEAIGSVVALGIGGSALAYLLYYAVITGAGASRAILITYLVPPTALFYGAVVLDEGIGLADLGGLVLILAGVALGSGTAAGWRRSRVGSLPA